MFTSIRASAFFDKAVQSWRKWRKCTFCLLCGSDGLWHSRLRWPTFVPSKNQSRNNHANQDRQGQIMKKNRNQHYHQHHKYIRFRYSFEDSQTGLDSATPGCDLQQACDTGIEAAIYIAKKSIRTN